MDTSITGAHPTVRRVDILPPAPSAVPVAPDPGLPVGRRATFVGLSLAIGLAGLPGVIALVRQQDGVLIILSIFGTPGAGLLGWRCVGLARRGNAADAFGRSLGMGFSAYLLGVGLASVLMTVGVVLKTPPDPVGPIWIAVIFVLGVIVASPALMVTIPCAIVWVVVIRRLPDRWLGLDGSR